MEITGGEIGTLGRADCNRPAVAP